MVIEKLLNHLSKTADGPLIDATGLEPALYWDPSIASLEEENIFRPSSHKMTGNGIPMYTFSLVVLSL